MEQTIISSDSHVIEVPDLWEKGVPSSFTERAPKAFFDEKRDAWMFGSAEVPVQAVGGLFMAGQRPDQVESFRRAGFLRGPPRRLGSARADERHGHRRRRGRSALSQPRSRFVLSRRCRASGGAV